jgi:hypothetical protein
MNGWSVRALSVFALAAILVGLSGLPERQAAQAAPGAAAIRMNTARNLAGTTFSGNLVSVTATSPTDAWAVGGKCATSQCHTIHTLTLHWDGTAWSKVSSPNPSPGLDTIGGVTATSSTDAWAVGNACPASDCTVQHTLILRWNGTAWSHVTSPNPGGNNVLNAATATSPTNAWAVGSYCMSGCGTSAEVEKTLILHWNGSSWSQVSSPSPGAVNFLNGMWATSSNNAWAAGSYCVSVCGGPGTKSQALLLHWNGTAWSKVKIPSPKPFTVLNAGTAISPTNAWAVGLSCNYPCGAERTLILHWNGSTWSQVKSPNPNGSPFLYSVSATSSTDAWAAGYYTKGSAFSTLILHWNGSTWSRVASPNPGPAGGNLLSGVIATSPTNAWAAGSTCTFCATSQVLILHWNGTAWSRN